MAAGVASQNNISVEEVLTRELRRFVADQHAIFVLPELAHNQVVELFISSKNQINGDNYRGFENSEDAVFFAIGAFELR